MKTNAARGNVRSGRGRGSLLVPSGFTLIELLLVMVILTILAAIVVPRFTRRTEQAKVTAARTDISNMEVALDAFEVDCGRYPTTEEGLGALVEQPANADGWRGPYLKKSVSKDPWGNAYLYRCPGSHNTTGYDLYSFGPDGQEGGDDDVDNWTSK
ncbi:MAG: type II secretion system major pseudopilin GspG [Phycisphaerae bacterium]|jgi:general secretion pathway protein G